MSSPLAVAEELERRDVAVAAALVQVETLERGVDEIRTAAGSTAAFLADAPLARQRLEQEQAAAAADVAATGDALRTAEAELARAEERRKEQELAHARRAVEHARAEAATAASRLERAREAAAQLEQDVHARTADAHAVATRAAAAATALAELPRLSREAAEPPGDGLDAILEWSSRARGALLLVRASLAGERERLVREANELAASVTGDAVAATSVAAVRARVARMLG